MDSATGGLERDDRKSEKGVDLELAHDPGGGPMIIGDDNIIMIFTFPRWILLGYNTIPHSQPGSPAKCRLLSGCCLVPVLVSALVSALSN